MSSSRFNLKQRADGRQYEELIVSLPPAVDPVNGDTESAGLDIGPCTTLRLDLDVTAAPGSATLDVKIETSKDNATWRQIGAFAQVTTSPVSERKSFGGCDRYVRANYDTGGSGAGYELTLTGEAL